MLKRKFSVHLIWLFLFLSACATAPLDTVNKKFAAFEVTYKSALTQIDQLEKTNSLKPETKTKLADVLKEVNKARTAAYLAKDAGDIRDAEGQISMAILLLERLQSTMPAGEQL